MKFLSLMPFIPSAKTLKDPNNCFLNLALLYCGILMIMPAEKDSCHFILQKFNNKEVAENLMITISADGVTAHWREINEKQLAQKLGIRVTAPKQIPYGKESILIDVAGVCRHFVE